MENNGLAKYSRGIEEVAPIGGIQRPFQEAGAGMLNPYCDLAYVFCYGLDLTSIYMAKKSYLFKAPVTKKFGKKTYFITDGRKPFLKKSDALKKASRIRKDGILCRVVPMNGEFYLYSLRKK